MAGIIITQGTDLSVGRQVGLAALIAATMLQALTNVNKVFPSLGEVPIPAVILLVCVVGALIGLVNGLIVAYLNVTPFITTLGTMIIVYGINSLYFDSVGASPVAGFDPRFSSFAQGFIKLGGFKLSYLTFYAAIASVFVCAVEQDPLWQEHLRHRRQPGSRQGFGRQRGSQPGDDLWLARLRTPAAVRGGSFPAMLPPTRSAFFVCVASFANVKT